MKEYYEILRNAVLKSGGDPNEHKIAVFSSHHWWQLLKGCGKYENIKKVYGNEFIKYSKMALNVHSNRIDNVLNIFPNHYDYLTEWYEKWWAMKDLARLEEDYKIWKNNTRPSG